MARKKYPRYLKAGIVTIVLGLANLIFSSINILKWQYILIMSIVYFIWEAFIERLVMGEE